MELLIGQRIRKNRKALDLTQEQLAAALGISPQSVSKWECGDGYPDITLLPVIANYFKITVDELIGNDELGRKEEQDGFWDGYNELYDRPAEQLEYCRNYYRKYPDDYRYMYEVGCVITRYEMREELPLLREVCEKIIDGCTEQYYRQGAAEYMCMFCEEGELERWLSLCAPFYDAHRGEVKEARLWAQKRYDESRLRHAVNNLHVLCHFLFRDSRNWAAPQKATAWYQFRIRMIESLATDGKIPDAWLGTYANSHFRAGCSSFGCGRKEDGYAYLEKAFELYPRWFAIPNGTALDVGDPMIFGDVKILKDEWRILLPDGSKEHMPDGVFFLDDRGEMYTRLTQKKGWEWFNGVRNEELFKEYVARAKVFYDEAQAEEKKTEA